MKKCFINIARYFFLILFLGFFGSNTFFDHTHIYDENIIVHSHPFKSGQDGKPLHSHNQSGYLLIFQINNIIVNIVPGITLAFIISFLYVEVISGRVNNLLLQVYFSPSLLRGPPSRKLI